MFDTLTDKQLSRLYNKILKKISNWGSGGDSFGIDYSTLYACNPTLALAYTDVKIALRARYYYSGGGI